jgi:hypothetical protein
MNAKLTHHVVTFPDCKLSFDYPADLKPSPDFYRDKMEAKVDYDTIRWVSSSASESFILMHSDFTGGLLHRVLATASISMWLARVPPTFQGNLINNADLRKAFRELMTAEKDEHANDPLKEVQIGDRIWLYSPWFGMYLTGLNRGIFVLARVNVTPNSDKQEKWADWAANAKEAVIGSLRIDPHASEVTAAAR